MEPRISLITLGVDDLDRAVCFYRDGLHWPQPSIGGGQVVFLRTQGTILSQYPCASLAADTGLPAHKTEFSGITLAHNVLNKNRRRCRIVRDGGGRSDRHQAWRGGEWGGYVGYFADPDGFVWEVAWNPGFPFADDGSVTVPE